MKNTKFEEDILLVPESFNSLSIVEESQEKFLKGSIEIIDRAGNVWATYFIEIKGSESYPFAFPKLYEVNSAFPKNSDWHVYENDFSCCIDVPMSEKIICKDGLNVVDYIKQYAVPYLANQTFRIKEGYYLYGEYSHGILGRIEYYQDKLKPKNIFELLEMFELIINDFNPKRTEMCPFCYKEKFRKCHREVFKEMQLVKEFIAYDRIPLIKFLMENQKLN